jgi:F0F1-type ATP synthase epsilon subunit
MSADAPQNAVAPATDAAGTPSMHIKVYSPYRIYFDKEGCQSITGINDTGPFDILPRHHNFMTLLNSGELTVHAGNDVERFSISRGIMHVKADRVVVFLDV